jgi:hypothetical protein
MNRREGEYVRVLWQDAALYSPQSRSSGPSQMITVGYVARLTSHGIMIRRPITKRKASKKTHPMHRRATFIFIPKGMISEVEKCRRSFLNSICSK